VGPSFERGHIDDEAVFDVLFEQAFVGFVDLLDGQGKSILSVSLARKNVERTEAFTRAHLGGKVAMVIDGEIVTLHKIRSVITGGKLQITRCTDNACEVIRAKLVR